MIGAIVGNHVARKAYERFGFRPAVMELAKDLAWTRGPVRRASPLIGQ